MVILSYLIQAVLPNGFGTSNWGVCILSRSIREQWNSIAGHFLFSCERNLQVQDNFFFEVMVPPKYVLPASNFFGALDVETALTLGSSLLRK